MLELGQPMHAFDLDKVRGGIEVRYANPSEKMTLLDGAEVELDQDVLLITSRGKPVAIAGVIGGLDSGVSEKTRDVLLECAFFQSRSHSWNGAQVWSANRCFHTV